MNTQRLSRAACYTLSFVVLLVLNDGSTQALNPDSPQRKPSKLQN
jgi:hypothetical protein